MILITLIALIVAAILIWPKTGTRASAIGSACENRVLKQLRRQGIPYLHDVHLCHRTGKLTQIDVLANLGDRIAVIEVKGHLGRIEFGLDQWTVIYGKGRRHTLYSPVKQNAGHCAAVAYCVGSIPLQNLVVMTDAQPGGQIPQYVQFGVRKFQLGSPDPRIAVAWAKLEAIYSNTDRVATTQAHLNQLKAT